MQFLCNDKKKIGRGCAGVTQGLRRGYAGATQGLRPGRGQGGSQGGRFLRRIFLRKQMGRRQLPGRHQRTSMYDDA